MSRRKMEHPFGVHYSGDPAKVISELSRVRVIRGYRSACQCLWARRTTRTTVTVTVSRQLLNAAKLSRAKPKLSESCCLSLRKAKALFLHGAAAENTTPSSYSRRAHYK